MPMMEGNMTGSLYDSASPATLHSALSGTRPEHGGSPHSFINNKSASAADQERKEEDSPETTAVVAAVAIGSKASPAIVPVSTNTRPNTTASPSPSFVSLSSNTTPDNGASTSASLSVVAPALDSISGTQEEAVAHPSTLASPAPSSSVTSFCGSSSSSLPSPTIPTEITTVSDHSFLSTRPPLFINTYSSSSQGHRRNTPSRDSVPRQTVIKALASVAHLRKPDLVLLDNPTSQSRIREREDSHGRSRSHCKSKSFSILSGMLSTQGGDGPQSLAESRSDLHSEAGFEAHTYQMPTSSSTAVPSTGISVADIPLVTQPLNQNQSRTQTQTQTQTHSPSQSLTDCLNDIAKSRLISPTSTPMATTPTRTTAVLSNANSAVSRVNSATTPNPDTATSPTTPATITSTITAIPNSLVLPSTLQSPCFYHERFADAVDIGKVLEEIKNDVSMSHSRLVATATGVREVSKQLQRRPIRRAVRNIMIVTKARDNQLVYLTRELACWLLRTPRYGSDLGVNVHVDAKLRNSRRFDAAGILAENPRFQHMLKYWTPDLCWSQPEKFDLVLTLGGDGTVLFTSWLFQRIVPPVLSFSLGSLGFMTTFEFEKYKEHLNRVMGDDGMKINLRMRFTCTVYRNNRLGSPQLEEGEQFEVLNELVIDRGPSPYVSNLELYGDDELLTVVQADGCIFSTPTGSTAYSLSAGGALVHPDIPAILLTPICPHTLSFRPMVLSDTMALRVSIPHNSRATAYCAFDGKGRLELRQGDHVTITASQYPFPTVTRTDTEWFESVSRTLRWNVRAAAQKPFDDGAAENSADELGWDIDTDSAFYGSEEGSVSASPIRRQMSLLGL